ncbi:MAG: membrane protein insertase YidC [Arenicella sp.]|nr:membrane protein insertase YidC [Arenicella sp.]
MENQRTFLFIALLAISAVLYQKWIDFNKPQQSDSNATLETTTTANAPVPEIAAAVENPDAVPSTPVVSPVPAAPPTKSEQQSKGQTVTVKTDLVIATINTKGGVIERMELLEEPVSIDKPDQGFPLLKNTLAESFVVQDGLLVGGQQAPNHLNTQFQSQRSVFELGQQDSIQVPLTWVSERGVQVTKIFTFSRDSYLVDIDYQIKNGSNGNWDAYLYAQFSRTEPQSSGAAFGQLPSYTGGAIYTEADKYQKIDFDDMRDENLALSTDNGWVAMLQHYFVAAWIPRNGPAKQFYTSVGNGPSGSVHRIGYKTLVPVQIAAGQNGSLGARVYLGSKEQSRLKRIAKEDGIEGLALTVDYGFLTFIADPLFSILSLIHGVVGNWGWAIILLTFLIKLVFYPLSAASYKSMAGMKKLQPRIQTLKERYKDDKQKFQMEMMALYKKEKINPAGGCLPILIQIPVFIALYWALLESVEMRQAPFALWLQDLSAPDPYFVLPVLMGLSMWAQQKLNPAPMDDIQKKVMTIMPIALTFLFLTFPQGLVLYWVVNNVLSMAQQWFINKQHAT